MSRPPLQQWPPFPDSRSLEMRDRVPADTTQGLPPYTMHPYCSAQEPPRYLYPGSQSYDPTFATSSQPRSSLQGKSWDSSSDHRYNYSSGSAGPLSQYGVQRASWSRNMEYPAGSSPFYETSSQGRGSIGSTGRSNDVDSQYSNTSTTFPSPVHSDNSGALLPSLSSTKHSTPYPRQQAPSVPMGFEKLLHNSPTPSPPPRRTSASPRYQLHIRQQPIAARACGAGDRDRRPVDPPPIIQMLLTDFDPEEDMGILQDPRFTVGCLLIPVTPSSQGTGDDPIREDRQGSHRSAPGQSTPLLSGKAFMSPFFVEADPDPETAPAHPTSRDNQAGVPASYGRGTQGHGGEPATFFIFSDLSIRTAGLYRLQFRLMNWGSVEDTGMSMPILAEAWSDPFRVYPAKDFPGMRDSSRLTEGLKELGFVELKTRGKGKGKGRRR
ncbi:velvet factor-domain-containing protein [Aspergillus ambiguus]|uniref:velvet factor family protein n=1 Tax=Aspergillus ambiguus TaxID=176160 RepID=UPI003CCE1C5F